VSHFASGFTCPNALTPGSVETRVKTTWFNPNAYGPDGSTGYGGSPRNCLTGPPQKNLDFTLGKSFRLTEAQTIRFRTDFFNLTNHPSFANPSGLDFSSPGVNPMCSFCAPPLLMALMLAKVFGLAYCPVLFA
jgi:hypothetical protein